MRRRAGRPARSWSAALVLGAGLLIAAGAEDRPPGGASVVPPAAMAAGPLVPLRRVDQVPTITVEHHHPREIVLGGRPYVMVYGILRNEGPGHAGRVTVQLTARRSPGGEVLGVGGGESWLDALDAGESGPFSVAVGHCCAADIGSYEFVLEAAPAAGPRYRALAVAGPVERAAEGGVELFGELRNAGEAYLDATATELFVGFWAGDDLVAVDTARLPVIRGGGPTGQSHPPGFAYPWALRVTAPPHDRSQVWTYAAPFPAGLHPVPVGVQNLTIEPASPGIRFSGTLIGCGVVPVESTALLVSARDPLGPLAFGVGRFDLPEPLAPGASAPFSATWPSAPAGLDPAELSLSPFALGFQAERPAEIFCPPRSPRAFLPALHRDSTAAMPEPGLARAASER